MPQHLAERDAVGIGPPLRVNYRINEVTPKGD
jgi:hypothetical protein